MWVKSHSLNIKLDLSIVCLFHTSRSKNIETHYNSSQLFLVSSQALTAYKRTCPHHTVSLLQVYFEHQGNHRETTVVVIQYSVHASCVLCRDIAALKMTNLF